MNRERDRQLLRGVCEADVVCESVFGLMDLNGDGQLDANQLKDAIADKGFRSGAKAAFVARFHEFLVSFSGGYDVITLETFRKIWNGKAFLDLLVDAIASEELSARSTMKFLIEVTSPR